MSAPVRIAPVDDWEIVTGQTYVVTPDHFRSGVIVTDAASGREYMVGETWNGFHTRTALNVPLCNGCDDPVPADGVCSGCRMIHADIAESETKGDPMLAKNRRAA
jgi:hypothetical protein